MAKGWTPQTLIDAKTRLTAFCHNPRCHHNQVLDLENLKAKLGPDALAMADDLIPKLRCAKCGGKAVGLTYTPDASPTGSYNSAASTWGMKLPD
ncbi:hypothetical protein NKJ51_12230 [Mesorhizobium sp. M0134]|uniref:hypothetical protein n=1 Tax=Mesorhizobium sp. M0134 TaxID=2956889 RepID=UPI00333BB6C3